MDSCALLISGGIESMAVNVMMHDGGGAPTPTKSKGSGSGSGSGSSTADASGKPDATKSSPAADKPAPTTVTKPAKPASSSTTKFTPKRDDEVDAPTLAEVAKANRNATPDDGPAPTSNKPKSGTSDKKSDAPTETDLQEATQQVIGSSTSNNGRADNLRTGSHTGSRDAKIKELQKKEEELRAEEETISEEIDSITGKIETGETTSSVVKTTVSVVTAPVTAIAGLFGKSNPVADAAGGAVENMLGLEESRDQLKEQQKALDEQQLAIEEEIKKLTDERTLNFLADVAYATGMPTEVAEYLETTDKIVVAEETGIGSDAAFDHGSKEIIVDDAVIENLSGDIEQLKSDGVIDEDGRILDPTKFDINDAKESGISTVVMLAHEAIHGAQDSAGVADEAYATVDEMVEGASATTESMPTADAEQVLAATETKAEQHRIDALEYDAYLTQETLELQAGREKQGFLTVLPDGSLQPREEAVANIEAFQNGEPIPHGPSQGQTFQGIVDEQASANAGQQLLLDLLTPGRRSPGRRSPGDQSPGELTPGRRSPGRRSPADQSPGELTPGRRSPGRRSPGDQSPGDLTPGRRSPGRRSPGRRSPGSDIGAPVVQAQVSLSQITVSGSLTLQLR